MSKDNNDYKPWIGRYDVVGIPTFDVLFVDDGYAIHLDSGCRKYDSGWLEGYFEDITKEYLSGTKIKVESEIHSKFIQDLCFSVGILWGGVTSTYRHTSSRFLLFNGGFVTWASEGHGEYYNRHENKEIFLPLPPRESVHPNVWMEPSDYNLSRLVVTIEEEDTIKYPNGEHKQHDLIIKWAKGAVIQYFSKYWFDVYKNNPCWDSSIKYREKPLSVYDKVSTITGKTTADELKKEGLLKDD